MEKIMDKKQHKKNLLDQLYKPFQTCTLCPLGNLGRTKVVFGDGNPDAKLMLIGEGPGRDEDLEGLPFVGRSGKLLTTLLESLGIARESLYITNIVKCRPPNNRAPLPQELSACTKLLLEKQIKIIEPKIICTLGSSATNALLQKKISITKVRGSLFSYQGALLLPAFHPAYILRNKTLTSFLLQDLKKAFSIAHSDLKKIKTVYK